MDIIKNEVITKADIEHTASQLIEQIDLGEVNALAVLQRLKAVGKLEEMIKSRLIDAAVTEAGKHKEKVVKIFGAEFEVFEAGISYDFANTGDPVWNQLKADADTIKEAMKEREAFLKAIKGTETILNEDTAELVTVTAPVRKSSTTIKVTIK